MRINRKLLLMALPGVMVGGLVLTIILGLGAWRVLAHYYYPVESIAKAAPTQPIAFSHEVHAGQLGINCTFCHRTVTTNAYAGMPSVQQCMFCHKEVKGVTAPAEIQKLQQYASNNQPINWIAVDRLPDHVQFTHQVHIEMLPKLLGLGPNFDIREVCSTCHGKIWQMQTVRQVRALTMGDCVDCHRKYNAPTDCATCHY